VTSDDVRTVLRRPARVRRIGDAVLPHRDGVLHVPEHQPVAVQSVRPDGRHSQPGGHKVR